MSDNLVAGRTDASAQAAALGQRAASSWLLKPKQSLAIVHQHLRAASASERVEAKVISLSQLGGICIAPQVIESGADLTISRLDIDLARPPCITAAAARKAAQATPCVLRR